MPLQGRDCTDGLRLPVTPRAPLLARAYVHQVGGGWPGDVLDDTVLATSELVSNAVRHAAGGVFLVVTGGPGAVRVEVHDDGAPLVRSRHSNGELEQSDQDDEHGRGLFIVAALAARWGVVERVPPPGKAVWFEREMPAAPDPTDGR